MSNKMRAAVVTGADRGLGQALTALLLQKGWRVCAGQFMPSWPQLEMLKERHGDQLLIVPMNVSSKDSVQAAATICRESFEQVDMLLNIAGILLSETDPPIRQERNDDHLRDMYDVNALGPLRVTEAFLPLMANSELKRLCYVSSEAGSINNARRTAWYGYCMSKTALNMAIKITHNRLYPEGYTFRVYHPGWMRSYMHNIKNPDATLEPEQAAVYALDYFLSDRYDNTNRSDEARLVMRDYLGHEWPW